MTHLKLLWSCKVQGQKYGALNGRSRSPLTNYNAAQPQSVLAMFNGLFSVYQSFFKTFIIRFVSPGKLLLVNLVILIGLLFLLFIVIYRKRRWKV